ncbi:hypothetical protein J3A72_001448 [Stenotrophomonas sp. PvP093]|uniref:HEPN/Toprim-associated domain-containing protein n=2 Tax=Pseudomonadota TaxID=1224 RepID=UPI0007B1BCCF|nr:HEPN/Toprim-associated domain-containing protein [Stenotrophomonas muris]KZE53901.1 hypothetical protein AVW14_08995 [Stenotrophomonas maltophilia]MBP2481156.1 hypothetical protein [Stenotrophomonas sp. PvP093]TGR53720.1 hypothetical protein EN842_11325 [bacterium M00.F.Ca.ET.199.01.1.1]TGT07579.1 hypothetical protein EN820_05790 [bacterium M00.F.Ca.ET.177.01.1.1]TGT64827.1 hypothetical protein EN813_005795 [Mesorhizobium sp. M00.F.Ca.ET.170.01.1.1]TGU14972.1 hypothetical protein EN806_058
MGTIIDLTVGGLEVDWSKNYKGIDHGDLFQEQDREPDGEFRRPLRTIVPRLELLGYRIETVRHLYEQMAKQWGEDQADFDDADPRGAEPLSFEELLVFVRAHPIQALDDRFVEELDAGKMRGRFDGSEIVARIPANPDHASNAYSERSYFGVLIDFLPAYAVLRLLAENPANLDLSVIWRYGPLVEAGWADASDFVPCTRREQTVLIATEGSSDVHILKLAIKLIRPEVADFFRFIDVSERHPFSGTGSLVKFAEGLAKIDVQNQVLVVLDNDAEGMDALEAIKRFRLPSNMRALCLPELDEFRDFPARGPDGVTNSDINGRAAAIECYLDLSLPNHGPATVVWTNYKEKREVYQGSLEFKDTYTRAFLNQTAESLRTGTYDVRKLQYVLDALIEESSLLAASVRTTC